MDIRGRAEHDSDSPRTFALLVSRLGSAATRRAVMPFLAAALVFGATVVLPACGERSSIEEAVEEVEDEAGDAKEELADEVDDRT